MVTISSNRPLTVICVDGTNSLSNTLISSISSAIDDSEDLNPGSVILIHVLGSKQPADLKPWPGSVDLSTVNRWERLLRRIERAPVGTLVYMERACTLLALELLLVTDRRIAAQGFSLACGAPEQNIWPSMALFRLCRQIGESRTRQFFLDRARLDSKRGMELGIIDEIHDMENEAEPHTAEHFLRYAPPGDFAVTRRLLQDSAATDFDECLGTYLAACDRTLRRAL